MNNQNICVFQGTFNPIHNAHIRVAEYVLNKYNFEKIIFIPAFNPPHKTTDLDMTWHRYRMVELATSHNPRFEVSDIEYEREGKSYSYLTIQELRKIYGIEGKINFIIGTDAFAHIESWYKSEKLKDLVKFLLFIREDDYADGKYNYLKQRGYEFEIQDLEYKDISSSEFRLKNVSDFVCQEVMEYIEKNGLYKNN